MVVLEVCCYSVVCVWEVECCGVDCIEFCVVLQEGGLIFFYGVLVLVCEVIIFLVYLIVCLCGGDFCYIEEEFVVMFNDICMVWDLGFFGLVIGVLDVDGQVDILWMKKIMVVVGLLVVIFYCVFDLCVDLCQVWKMLGMLGVKCILIFGQ